jgi:hypothetical protein
VVPTIVFLGRKILSSLKEQLPKCLTRKFKGVTVSKSNIVYITEFFLKHKYLKWSFILELKVITKRKMDVKFSNVFLPQGGENLLIGELTPGILLS